MYVCVVSLGGMWACADFLLYCGWASVSAVPGSKRHRSSFKCHNPTILLAFRFSPGLSLCCLSFCLFAGKTFLPRRSTWSWARRQKEEEIQKISSVQTRDALPYRNRKFSVSGYEWRDRGESEGRWKRPSGNHDVMISEVRPSCSHIGTTWTPLESTHIQYTQNLSVSAP